MSRKKTLKHNPNKSGFKLIRNFGRIVDSFSNNLLCPLVTECCIQVITIYNENEKVFLIAVKGTPDVTF